MEQRGVSPGTGGGGPGRGKAGRREGGAGEAGRIAWRITLSLTDGDALTVLRRGVGFFFFCGWGGGDTVQNEHLKRPPPPPPPHTPNSFLPCSAYASE